MALIDELKKQRAVYDERYQQSLLDHAVYVERLNDLDRAIAALEPEAPPAPQPVDEADKPLEPEQMVVDAAEFGGVEIPEGFLRAEGEQWTGDPDAVVETIVKDGMISYRNPMRAAALYWGAVKFYRIISQPAESEEQPEQAEDAASGDIGDTPPESGMVKYRLNDGTEIWAWQVTDFSVNVATKVEDDQPIESEGEAHTDGVRNDSQQDEGAGERADPQTTSITQDPELIAAAERAQATLDADTQVEVVRELRLGNGEVAFVDPPAAYVGLNDPDLDAEFEAMKAREAAEKPKARSFWETLGGRKLEGV